MDLKQNICNQIVGVSHKDIENSLKDLLIHNMSKQEEDMLEIEETCPEKLHGHSAPTTRSTYRLKLQYLLDQEEINALIAASETEISHKSSTAKQKYPTYSMEETNDLLNDKYKPTKPFKKK